MKWLAGWLIGWMDVWMYGWMDGGRDWRVKVERVVSYVNKFLIMFFCREWTEDVDL
jgi:hypothetical protein